MGNSHYCYVNSNLARRHCEGGASQAIQRKHSGLLRFARNDIKINLRALLKITDSDFRQNLIRTMGLWEIAGMLNLIQYRNDALCHSDESQNLIRTMGLWEIAGQARNDALCHSDESQNLIGTMDLWEIAGQARNDALCHSDESQNLIRTMDLWEIAGQARNDNTLFLETPLT
ncbi:MAG: hypothetical protein LBC98_04765 [Prevotellaceae bacterium]|jgi:hypothetical protein|nr:hypothetical protein [Prevotellaceae bacterium]